MWIIKGAFLGTRLFAFGTIGFLYFAVYRNLPPNSAVGVTVIAGYTTQNPLWWAALLLPVRQSAQDKGDIYQQVPTEHRPANKAHGLAGIRVSDPVRSEWRNPCGSFKGIVLGVVLFVIGFFVYAFAVARRIHLRWDSAVYGLGDLLRTLTARNPYFWLAFAGALMIGCAMVRCWPHNEIIQFDPATLRLR